MGHHLCGVNYEYDAPPITKSSMTPLHRPSYLVFYILVALLGRAQLDVYLAIISHFSNLKLSPGKSMKKEPEKSFIKLWERFRKFFLGAPCGISGTQKLAGWCRVVIVTGPRSNASKYKYFSFHSHLKIGYIWDRWEVKMGQISVPYLSIIYGPISPNFDTHVFTFPDALDYAKF